MTAPVKVLFYLRDQREVQQQIEQEQLPGGRTTTNWAGKHPWQQ
ncbi:hypothetical protein [Pseudomonas glycinae]|nr:hypothetical protein [Pseudomonas glycinae]